MYWSATDFTGNDTTWYFTDNPDSLSGQNEISDPGHNMTEEKSYVREYRLLPKYQSGRFLVIEKAPDTGYLRINEIIMTFAEMRKFNNLSEIRIIFILFEISVDTAPPLTDCSEVYRIGQKTEGLANNFMLRLVTV